MKNIKLLALLSVLISSTIYSDIKLDSSKLQNTTIEQGKKGNTIININTPNGKGISVNDFENFQTKNGVIFNNAGQRMNVSQLEGIIKGNPNITGDQAKLILNRVGGTNRAEIEGVMEAVGRNKVDMIFTSPNGIYLDGAKFVGFKDVTFTTAPVNLDGEGNIQNLTIDKGNIEVGRKGLDASKLEQLSLLSSQIYIDGSVKGKNLNFIAGDFDYNVNDKSYINKEAENKSISISSSEFGSIYGSQVNVVVSNGNIGIKGDIIAREKIFMDIAGGEIYSNLEADEEINIKNQNNLKTYGDLYSNGDFLFELSKGTYENYGNMEATNMTFRGKGSNVNNHGNIMAANDFSIGLGFMNKNNVIVNNLIYLEDVRFTNFNSYLTVLNDIVSDSKPTSGFSEYEGSLSNIGPKAHVVLGGNIKLGYLLNDSKFDAYNSIMNISQFSNSDNGTLIVEGNLNVNSLRIENEGTIQAENLIMSASNLHMGNGLYMIGLIENKGILNVKNNIELKSQRIANSGELNTKNLKLIVKDFSSRGGKITADKILFENSRDFIY